MTEKEAIDRVIDIANAEVGYPEGENNWNKYAAYLDPMGITYGSKQNQPWCGEFVLAVFVKAFGAQKALEILCSGNPSAIPLCSAGAQYFKDAKRWTAKPERGDIVFFYRGGINHTGIVTMVSNGMIQTVEGNSSDRVSRNAYAENSVLIAGYGRPLWSAVSAVVPVDPPEEIEKPTVTKTTELPLLRKGDKGEVVRAAQFLLNGRDCSCGVWGADGDFGTATESATLAFQRRNELEADGIIGAQTWAALLGVK